LNHPEVVSVAARAAAGWTDGDPRNEPYYRRCGFRTLGENELTSGLVAIRRREAAHGLDRWPRVCMRREL
jgi:hypothetical protein